MKHITIKKKCPSCKDGEMQRTGVCYTSYPALYGHKCDKCDKMGSYKNTYPYSYDEYDPTELEERWEA
jgi:transposase-like protein